MPITGKKLIYSLNQEFFIYKKPTGLFLCTNIYKKLPPNHVHPVSNVFSHRSCADVAWWEAKKELDPRSKGYPLGPKYSGIPLYSARENPLGISWSSNDFPPGDFLWGSGVFQPEDLPGGYPTQNKDKRCLTSSSVTGFPVPRFSQVFRMTNEGTETQIFGSICTQSADVFEAPLSVYF